MPTRCSPATARSCGCLRIEAIKRTNAKHGSVADRMRLVDGTCVDCLERGVCRRTTPAAAPACRRRAHKWIAVITFKKKVHYLGIFETKEEAIRVRKEAEKHYFGTFLEEYYANKAQQEADGEQPKAENAEAPQGRNHRNTKGITGGGSNAVSFLMTLRTLYRYGSSPTRPATIQVKNRFTHAIRSRLS